MRDFLENIDVMAIVVAAVGHVNLPSDPNDNVILATAIAGQAEMIVSGEKLGMLNLGDVQSIGVVTPREALNRLEVSCS